MGRGQCVLVVGRNSMTTSDAADKVRVQCIEGSGFWRSENQESRKGIEEYDGSKVKRDGLTKKR